MKNYVYKIQWLFPVNGNFVTKTLELRNQLYSVIKIIGVKSLTEIIFRDKELKPIETYTRFISYPNGVAEHETIKHIKNVIKKNDNVFYVELFRR